MLREGSSLEHVISGIGQLGHRIGEGQWCFTRYAKQIERDDVRVMVLALAEEIRRIEEIGHVPPDPIAGFHDPLDQGATLVGTIVLDVEQRTTFLNESGRTL